MKNRRFKRISYTSRATVSCGERSFEAITDNLSLDGLFVHTDHRLAEGRPVEITFDLPSASRNSTITVNGIVVRSDALGLAFQFRSLDHDSFSYLRTVIDRKSTRRQNPCFNA